MSKIILHLNFIGVSLDLYGDCDTTSVTVFSEWQTEIANSRRCSVFWHQVALAGNVNK
jgi:hypothetical protein